MSILASRACCTSIYEWEWLSTRSTKTIGGIKRSCSPAYERCGTGIGMCCLETQAIAPEGRLTDANKDLAISGGERSISKR
eukprot:4744013-Amphidinium_carterae.1